MSGASPSATGEDKEIIKALKDNAEATRALMSYVQSLPGGTSRGSPRQGGKGGQSRKPRVTPQTNGAKSNPRDNKTPSGSKNADDPNRTDESKPVNPGRTPKVTSPRVSGAYAKTLGRSAKLSSKLVFGGNNDSIKWNSNAIKQAAKRAPKLYVQFGADVGPSLVRSFDENTITFSCECKGNVITSYNIYFATPGEHGKFQELVCVVLFVLFYPEPVQGAGRPTFDGLSVQELRFLFSTGGSSTLSAREVGYAYYDTLLRALQVDKDLFTLPNLGTYRSCAIPDILPESFKEKESTGGAKFSAIGYYKENPIFTFEQVVSFLTSTNTTHVSRNVVVDRSIFNSFS